MADNSCMTLPRQVVPGRDYMLTRRCSERRFFLRPADNTNNAFIYVWHWLPYARMFRSHSLSRCRITIYAQLHINGVMASCELCGVDGVITGIRAEAQVISAHNSTGRGW
jgi:hypothetical protein